MNVSSYFKERSKAINIFLIRDSGSAMFRRSREIGNKKIIKPTEFEIIEFIGKCKLVQQQVLSVVGNQISDDDELNGLLEQLKNIHIANLYDCNETGRLIERIGILYEKKQNYNRRLFGTMIRFPGTSVSGPEILSVFGTLLIASCFARLIN